ncbi:hypothetical protein V2J09_012425 [Rumex salicifolius]
MARLSKVKRSKAKKAAEAEALSAVPGESQNLQSGAAEKKNVMLKSVKKKKTKPNNHPEVDAASRKRIIQLLRNFRDSPEQEYTFKNPLKIEERALIHELSRSMCMSSKGTGKGADRTVFLRKLQKMKTKSLKDKIRFLKFSEESKEVLLNLFMQYPPGQDGLKQLKLNGCSRMKKKTSNKWDDTFCKPMMKREDISKKVKALSLRVKNDKDLSKINEQRSKLPIASYRDAILSEIENHQVVLVSGETGCGKTTQVPQYLLDKMWESGQTCKIICTQPRRISATSGVAERISQERGESVGETVGYKIRLESRGGRQSSLMLCTNGILLRLLVTDGLVGSDRGSSSRAEFSTLSQITYIVVDEIHERDHYSDFILAILRDMLPGYPHLRLVLMSATMDVERFSQYFGGCPIIEVPGFTYPVKNFYLEDVLSILKSAKDNNSDVTLPSSSSEQQATTAELKMALDEAIDLAWSDDELDALLELIAADGTSKVLNYQHSQTGLSPLMVFAAKGRAGDICMLLSLGADSLLKAKDGSTALDCAKRAEQTEAAEAISGHLTHASLNSKNSQKLVDEYLSSVDPQLIDIILIEKLLRKICIDSKSGAILVFLSSWDDINRTRERLLANQFFKDPSKFLILPLHSMVPSTDQKKVFNRPPHGCRKIILSTNIAETAVTIDDVVYVIDSGRLKEKSYDPYSNVSTLQSSWVSKASAKQRAGRSGRCQPGVCYHLYSKLQAEGFPEYRIPEIKRMPIEELCLQVKMLNPNYDIGEFLNKTLDPPVYEAIKNAVSVLKEIGALSSEEILTELGYQLGSLPVNPLTSKMLFFAILFKCVDPALTLACASYYRDPFTLPMLPEEKKKAADARVELAALYGGHSEQLAVVAAFECWENAKKNSLKAKFCSEYFLSYSTMNMLSNMRKQLQRELMLMGYIPDKISKNTCNQNAREPGILHALLVAGLYPKVGRVNPSTKSRRNMHILTASGDSVRVNYQSTQPLSSLKKSSDSALVVYNEMTQGDMGLQVKKCSIISNIPLVLVANEIAVAPSKDNHDGDSESKSGDNKGEIPNEGEVMSSADNHVLVVLDRWLFFKSTALEAAQIYCLRERLSAAISFQATKPRKALPPPLSATVDAIAHILSSDVQPRKSFPSNSVEAPTMPASTNPTPSSFLRSLFSMGDWVTRTHDQGITPKYSRDDTVTINSVAQETDQETKRKKKKSKTDQGITPKNSGDDFVTTSSVARETDQETKHKKKKSKTDQEITPKNSGDDSITTSSVPQETDQATKHKKKKSKRKNLVQSSTVNKVSVPETSTGFDTRDFGPYGPRGASSKKRRRSGM